MYINGIAHSIIRKNRSASRMQNMTVIRYNNAGRQKRYIMIRHIVYDVVAFGVIRWGIYTMVNM